MPDLRYDGGDPARALTYFREHRADLRALRRVFVGPDGTTVKDINGDEMFLEGLTLGQPQLESLLKLAGASYNPSTLHDPPRGRSPVKEFEIVKQDPWGHDRVL